MLALTKVITPPISSSRIVSFIFAELITSVPYHNPTFIARNFTDAEIAYCRAQPSPASSFAARWVGKEAVFKSLGVKSAGAAAAMKDIEILNNDAGIPSVHLHGEARVKAQERGVANVLISLSHSEVSRAHHVLFASILTWISRILPSHLRKPRQLDSLTLIYLVFFHLLCIIKSNKYTHHVSSFVNCHRSCNIVHNE